MTTAFEPTPATSSTSTQSLKSYLLGLFIVVQLAFIAVANVGSIALYNASSNPAAALIWEVGGAFSEPWAHVTGQEQYWRMFAPSVPARAMFIRMRLRLEGATELLPSDFEAPPGEPILHWPGPGERLWHVEKDLAAPFVAYDPDEVAANPNEWRAYLENAINAQRHRYLAYMAWKVRRYQDATGDKRAPQHVDLLISIHTRSWHDRHSTPESELLTLRWTPSLEPNVALQLCTQTPQGDDCACLPQ